jgi:hypothetical protein
MPQIIRQQKKIPKCSTVLRIEISLECPKVLGKNEFFSMSIG